MQHRRYRHTPFWWPQNEPWPPQTAHASDWRLRRARFLRRAAVLFVIVLLLSMVGAITLISVIANALSHRSSPVTFSTIAATILAIVFVLGVMRIFVRGFGAPFSEIVGAADRVANGDYSARVPAHGPPVLRNVANAFNKMTERLEAQDRQRRDLMADIAHELRTPLSVIEGQLEGILDRVYSRDDVMLGKVLDEARVVGRLVSDLGVLANAESGTLTLHKELTDLSVLGQEVVNSFSPEAKKSDISISLVTPPELPLVSVDPLRIREILSNLISNAIHHTLTGGSVSVRVESSEQQIIFNITDTGSGIAQHELPKIFDRFYKGSASRGSGLGLTIARNLVNAHGGEIRAESQPGKGATFVFTLPIT